MDDKQNYDRNERIKLFNISHFRSIQSVWNIKDSIDKKNVKKKIEALDSYIQSIFKQKAYYQFDPEREIHHNQNMVTPRQTILSHPEDRTRISTSNTLSQYLGTEDKKEGFRSYLNSGQKDENFLRKFSFISDINENDYFEKNQQVLEKRYNFKERYINGINMNRVIISVNQIMIKLVQSKQFRNEKKEITEYQIFLEEFDTFGNVTKQIRLFKDYDQIKQLDNSLKKVYEDVNMEYPSIPYNRQPINQFLADEMKKEFDSYFERLLELRFVEQNIVFESFLHLSDLQQCSQYFERDMIIYDFTKVDEGQQNHQI